MFLIFIAYLAVFFLPVNPHYFKSYQIIRQGGWLYSDWRPLDIWGRWDSDHYLNIVKNGYAVCSNVYAQDARVNAQFAPLFPFAVKLLTFFCPPRIKSDFLLYLTGIMLANIFLLAGLELLRRLLINLFPDRDITGRTIWYLLLFPSSFFFSCLYPEALFFLLTVAVFYFAGQKKWWAAGLAGFLLALTRPNGFIITLPLLVMYFEDTGFRPAAAIKSALLWLFCPLAGLAILFGIGFVYSGDPLIAPHHAMLKFHLQPWKAWLRPYQFEFSRYMTPIEMFLLGVMIFLGFRSFKSFKSRAFAIFALITMVIPLFTNDSLISTPRYNLILFPCFVALAVLGKNRRIHYLAVAIFLFLQAILMALWSQFYWVA